MDTGDSRVGSVRWGRDISCAPSRGRSREAGKEGRD